MNTDKPKRKVGRPRNPPPQKVPDLKEQRQNKNEKLGPKRAAEFLYKELEYVTSIGIYGIDDYTKAMIDELWKDPEKTIAATDTNPARLDNINRVISQRSFSMYRWEAYPSSGFIEEPVCEVIIVSKDCAKELKSRPNPYDTPIIVMEDVTYGN